MSKSTTLLVTLSVVFPLFFSAIQIVAAEPRFSLHQVKPFFERAEGGLSMKNSNSKLTCLQEHFFETATIQIESVIVLPIGTNLSSVGPSPGLQSYPFSQNILVWGGAHADMTPTLAIDSAGNIHAVFEVYYNARKYIGYSKSLDTGKTWCFWDPSTSSWVQGIVLINTPNPAAKPYLTIDPATGYIWIAHEYSYFSAQQSTDGGKTWFGITISSWVGYANHRNPTIACYGGRIYISTQGPYTQAGLSTIGIYIFRSDDGGVNWQYDCLYDDTFVIPFGNPSATIGGSYFHVAFQNRTGADWNVVWVRAPLGTFNWGYPWYTHNPTQSDESPQITATGNYVYIVEEQYTGTSYDICGAFSTDYGATWTAMPGYIINTNANERYPAIDANGQNVQIAFVNASTAICYLNSTDMGNHWSSVEVVVDNVGTVVENYRCVCIALDTINQPHIVWDDNRNGNVDVYFARRGRIAVNQPPNTPAAPQGPSSGNVGITYQFTAVTTDPDGDQIMYTFDWGDGTTDSTSYYNSGVSVTAVHAWSTAGTYSVKVQAKDASLSSGWSPPATITITDGAVNQPPATPSSPTGITNGFVGITYQYTAVTTDPDGDQIKYVFDWGDGTTSDTAFVNSGAQVSCSHAWQSPSVYNVRVMAVDIKSAASQWSPPLQVTINQPSGKVVYIITREPLRGSVVVDGTEFTAPAQFEWSSGEVHTVSVVEVDIVSAGQRYAFKSWSDGGARIHSITVGTKNENLCAYFLLQWKPRVVLEGTDSAHRVKVEYTQLAAPISYDTHTIWEDWLDDRTSLTFSNQTLDSTVDGRWHTTENFAQPPWSEVTNSFSNTITYYHQYKPRVTLAGVMMQQIVEATYVTHGYRTTVQIPLSWSDWVDAGSALALSQATKDSTDDERWHTYTNFSAQPWVAVTNAFTATVRYYHQYRVTLTIDGLAEAKPASIRVCEGGAIRDYRSSGSWSGWVDANSNLNISSSVLVTEKERYATASKTDWVVASAFSAVVGYTHQYKVSVTTKGLPEKYAPTLTYYAIGVKVEASVAVTWTGWVDSASILTVSDTLFVSETERYYSTNRTNFTVQDGLALFLTYYHQWKVTIELEGTSAENGVTVSYTANGVGKTEENVCGKWSKWLDDNTVLEFSKTTTDGRLVTTDKTNWTVTWAVQAVIKYVLRQEKTVGMEILAFVAIGAVVVIVLLFLVYRFVTKRAKRKKFVEKLFPETPPARIPPLPPPPPPRVPLAVQKPKKSAKAVRKAISIGVRCPACGFSFPVPIEEADEIFVCPKCGAEGKRET